MAMLPVHLMSAQAGHVKEWIGYTRDERDKAQAERAFRLERQPKALMRRTFPSCLLRREFQVSNEVRSATVRVCGLGLHELYLNGSKVGDRVLDPAPTSYDKRSFVATHDVTGQVQAGGNVIGLWLGNGFYGQDFGFAPWLEYGEPRAWLRLEIEYVDGTQDVVVTGDDWKAAQSPVLFDNIYAGETYDARLEQPGWCSTGFDDAGWNPVRIMDAPTANLVEQELEPIRKVRAIRPVAICPAENGEWIVDLGENIAGWLQLHLDEPRGTVVEMRFAEVLMPGGEAIDTATTGVDATGCEQIDVYICKGGGETWEPRFTYHGFRHVQISGLSRKPAPDDFTGWLVGTDLERIGTFECSDPLINKFYAVSLRTIESNVHGNLTDCPHRERCAWLGDMHATAEAISMNYDARNLWRKQVEDFKTVLGVERTVPQHYPKDELPPKDPRAPANIACGKRLCGQARPDWGVAVVLVPWFNWLYFGDRETVENAWPMMNDYMQFLLEKEVNNHLIKEGYAYGDWCPPGSNSEMDTPPQLSATVLYYRSAKAMEQMAGLLGRKAEQEEYERLAARIKTAFNRAFLDREQFDYGSQTGTAMALNCGLAPDGHEMVVAEGLSRLIRNEGNGHYTTGILGHRHLYTALNDHGFGDVTRKLWNNTGFPSLAFMTETHDLTVWPEVPFDWPEGERYGRSSFSHPMQSGFAVAFHESLGGIRPDPEHPGFERFILRPCFLPGLEWAKAEYLSPRGKISSHWAAGNGALEWTFTIPEKSFATVILPPSRKAEIRLNGEQVADRTFELGAGDWEINIEQ